MEVELKKTELELKAVENKTEVELMETELELKAMGKKAEVELKAELELKRRRWS